MIVSMLGGLLNAEGNGPELAEFTAHLICYLRQIKDDDDTDDTETTMGEEGFG